MNLSADTFLQIVQSLRSDVAGKNGREQRKNPRVGVRGRAMIAIAGVPQSKPIQVSVRDLSAAGIGLLHSEPIAKGVDIILLLPEANDVGRRAIVCHVRRVQQLSPSLYSIGASFAREVGATDLQAAAAPARPAVPAESPEPPFTLAPAPAASPPAPPKPAAAKPAGPLAIPKVAQGISQELLDGADANVVNAVERRLRQAMAG